MKISEIESFLGEDVGDFDIFHDLLPDKSVKAEIVPKQDGVLAGLEEAIRIFDYCGISYSCSLMDGDMIAGGETTIRLEGSSRAILRAERVSLNFLGRMSGIATIVRLCVGAVAQTGVTIACTRKTTPGFRKFEKKAVVIGGGDPHRFNLTDAVMIKDNHIRVNGMDAAYRCARDSGFMKKVEIEVENAEDAMHAAELGADVIMFDNMNADSIVECISSLKEGGLRDSVVLEASGGITTDNLVLYAKTGVDVISMGALTHPSLWLDFGLDVE